MKRAEEFGERIRREEERRLKARKEKRHGLFFGLGMFGMVGWSVAVPALVFTAIGVWLDSRVQGQYSWTLMLLLIGIIVGCLNAWFWIKKESKNEQ